jgi:hypothetical protein
MCELLLVSSVNLIISRWLRSASHVVAIIEKGYVYGRERTFKSIFKNLELKIVEVNIKLKKKKKCGEE